MKYKIPKKHYPDRHRGIIYNLEEWIGGQRYLVFKFPDFVSVNEVKQFVETAWMKEQGHWIGKNHFLGSPEQLETRRERKKYVEEKRLSYSKKPRPQRSIKSKKFVEWVKGRGKILSKRYLHEPVSKIAEYIFDEREDLIASCKAVGKPAPRHYKKEYIQKILY